MPQMDKAEADIILKWLQRLDERVQVLEGHQFPKKETPKREAASRPTDSTLPPE